MDDELDDGDWAAVQAGLDDVAAGQVVPHEQIVRETREHLAAIRAGIADMRAGRVTPHDEVMREMEQRHPELGQS